MRIVLASLGIVCLVAAGCGSSNASDDGGGTGGNGTGGPDLSASAQDLAASGPVDLGPLNGCKGLAACIDACTSFTCVNTCRQSATTSAQQLYVKLAGCERNVCYPHPDAGPAPCSGGGGGTPSAQCTMCLDDVVKMTGTCQGGQPGWCGACYTQYQTCMADTP